MHDTETVFLYKSVKWFVVAVVLTGFQSIYADEVINYSNCMQHLGGGGFGDFDCYENHAKRLEVDNKRISNAIKLARGVTGANKAELSGYMRAQDDVAKTCDLAIRIEYPSRKERTRNNHIELYDVMAARCHYSIRNQQNEFLQDLFSITDK